MLTTTSFPIHNGIMHQDHYFFGNRHVEAAKDLDAHEECSRREKDYGHLCTSERVTSKLSSLFSEPTDTYGSPASAPKPLLIVSTETETQYDSTIKKVFQSVERKQDSFFSMPQSKLETQQENLEGIDVAKVYMRQWARTRNIRKDRLPFIFERDHKVYQSESEKRQWQSRIRLFEKVASATGFVFSISIVPTDPSILQSWYYKKSYKINEDLADLPDAESQEFLESNCDENSISSNPPPTFRGFTKPYLQFDSKDFGADIDPMNPDRFVEQHYVSSKESIQEAIRDIRSEELQTTTSDILDSFMVDENAAEMSLILLEPNEDTSKQVKRILFTKPFVIRIVA